MYRVLDYVEVGRVTQASRKFLHEGQIWIEVRALQDKAFILDQEWLGSIPGPETPLPNNGAAPFLFAVGSCDLQLHDGPSSSSAVVGTVRRHYNVEVSRHVFDERSNQIWGLVSRSAVGVFTTPLQDEDPGGDQATCEGKNDDDTEVGPALGPPVSDEAWVCTHEVHGGVVALARIDLVVGEPWCFQNVFENNRGHMPIRHIPHFPCFRGNCLQSHLPHMLGIAQLAPCCVAY